MTSATPPRILNPTTYRAQISKAMWRDYLSVKTASLVFFLWFTAIDFFILSLAWGAKGDPQKYGYGLGKETYLTPSPWVFGILLVIHLLFAGNVLYVQWTTRGKELILQGLTFRFSGLMLLDIIWAATWARQWYIASFISAVLLAGLSTSVYLYLKRATRFDADSDLLEHAFIHVPFSLFHAWTMFILFVNGFAAFAPTSSTSGDLAKVFAIWGLVLLAAIAVGYTISVAEGDIIGTTVISLALLSIFTHQKDPWIHWTALACTMIATMAAVRSIIGAHRARIGGQIRLDSVGGVRGVTPLPAETV